MKAWLAACALLGIEHPILNASMAGTATGTLAAAVGLGLRLWVVGAVLWFLGHIAAVWATHRDPDFVEVVRRHLHYPPHLAA